MENQSGIFNATDILNQVEGDRLNNLRSVLSEVDRTFSSSNSFEEVLLAEVTKIRILLEHSSGLKVNK